MRLSTIEAGKYRINILVNLLRGFTSIEASATANLFERPVSRYNGRFDSKTTLRIKGGMMKEVSPQEANDLMQNDPDYIYLDVRSVPEFDAGHAAGAINIPIMHFTPGIGMSPNEDFPSVVEKAIPKDAKVVVGCKTGMRSARACEVMGQMGYTNIANVRGGFVGMTDNFGRVVEPGWSMLGLPTCSDCDDQSHYEAIAAKAKR
jgi:rhodanese-related sulfurtransferase